MTHPDNIKLPVEDVSPTATNTPPENEDTEDMETISDNESDSSIKEVDANKKTKEQKEVETITEEKSKTKPEEILTEISDNVFYSSIKEVDAKNKTKEQTKTKLMLETIKKTKMEENMHVLALYMCLTTREERISCTGKKDLHIGYGSIISMILISNKRITDPEHVIPVQNNSLDAMVLNRKNEDSFLSLGDDEEAYKCLKIFDKILFTDNNKYHGARKRLRDSIIMVTPEVFDRARRNCLTLVIHHPNRSRLPVVIPVHLNSLLGRKGRRNRLEECEHEMNRINEQFHNL